MDGDTESRSFLFTKANSNFRTRESVLGAISNDDVREILQVVIWKDSSILPTTIGRTISAVSKVMKSALVPPRMPSTDDSVFWAEVDTLNLLQSSGKYADVFISEFDRLCRDLETDTKTTFVALRNWLIGNPLSAQQVTMFGKDPPDPVGALREGLQSLHNMITQEVDVSQCVHFYRQTVFPMVVAEIEGLAACYDCQLANCEPVEQVQIEKPEYQELFNHLILEMNCFLEAKNVEIKCQHVNFKRMCALLKETQTKVFNIMEEGGFNRLDLQNFVSRTMEMLEHVEKCSKAEVTVAVCGETSVGKTTLIGGIVGALCFPTSQAANTACPIRISIRQGCSYRTLRIPSPLLAALESALEAIRQSLVLMKRQAVPTDMPLCVCSEEARDMYNLALNASGPAEVFEPYIGSDAVENDSQIRECISRINGLIRLVYNLKASPRFQQRLSNIHPLSVLLEARNVLTVLPEVTASCVCVETMPFVGGISFIDTPGVSEFGENGSYLFHMRLILRSIFERTNRTIILTTPGHLSNSAFKTLRELCHEVVDGPDRMLIAVNKFDTVDPGKDLEYELGSYRSMFGLEGCTSINVQILQAKLLRDITFGLRELSAIGGLEYLKKNKNATLGTPAQSLLDRLYGEKFKKYIGKYTDEDVYEDSKDLARQSNFENIIRIALQPAFLRAMEVEPAACLLHEAASLTSLITSLNARLAGIQQKAAAMKLLQDSIDKIEAFFAIMPLIRKEIEETLLKEFQMTARVGQETLMRKLVVALEECEKEASRPARRDMQRLQSVVESQQAFFGRQMTIKFATEVYYTNKNDCLLENQRVLRRVNEVLAGSDIELNWEINRRVLITGEHSIIAKHLTALKNQITKPLSADVLTDARLLDVFDSIQREILNCNSTSEISAKSSCVCSLYPMSETALRERDDVVAAMLRFLGVSVNGSEVYVPGYGVFKQIVPLFINRHYSDENCLKEVEAGSADLTKVMDNLSGQLDSLRLRLQSVLDQLKYAVNAEDETKLRRDIRELNKCIQEHRLLKDAIALRSSEDEVAARTAISTADLDAWKGRMVSEGINSETLANMTPINQLFQDCDQTILFEDAKNSFIAGCEMSTELNHFVADLVDGADNALEHATRQFQKRMQPAEMRIDELTALKWYTLNNCFFGILNKTLREGNRETIFAFRKMIWLILLGMKKLSPSSKNTVYRGITMNMVDKFIVGQKIVWPAFTSTSTTMKIAGGIDFFASPEPGSIAYRTFFYISLTTRAARSLSSVSVLPEEEILLPPYSTFEVIDVSHLYVDGRLDVVLREVESVDALMSFSVERDSEPSSPTTTYAVISPRSTSSFSECEQLSTSSPESALSLLTPSSEQEAVTPKPGESVVSPNTSSTATPNLYHF
jgi:hypothetical protein